VFEQVLEERRHQKSSLTTNFCNDNSCHQHLNGNAACGEDYGEVQLGAELANWRVSGACGSLDEEISLRLTFPPPPDFT
jgi:hypothetical protein